LQGNQMPSGWAGKTLGLHLRATAAGGGSRQDHLGFEAEARPRERRL
jgi:hypothetical protein